MSLSGILTQTTKAIYLPAHCVEYIGIPANNLHDRYIGLKTV